MSAPRRTATRHAALLLAAAAAAAALAAAPANAPAADDAPPPPPDHAAFDALLARYATPDGVRWAAWHASAADRAALQDYVDRLAAARPSALARDDRLAYWIDLYNALTLDLVLDGYPVESIKDRGGFLSSPWSRDIVTVEGRDLTLDDIENRIIRPEFGDPRIHFALNCAARSCPPLRPEAFVGARLDAQLEAATRDVLADPRYARFDAETSTLRVTKVLDWYRGDFVTEDGGLVDWLRPYVPGLAAHDGDVRVRFDDYDWSLNEAP